jgi:hypothetical protein
MILTVANRRSAEGLDPIMFIPMSKSQFERASIPFPAI